MDASRDRDRVRVPSWDQLDPAPIELDGAAEVGIAERRDALPP